MADYISVPSDFAKSTFISSGVPENKIIVTPYGVNLTDFQPSERHDRAFRLVYAGQMSLRKGVHYLLQAFSELSLPDAELWLVGPRHPEIEPFFTRFDGSFRYFEAQPERKLAEIYGKCSAFVICSLEEGLAPVQLQAMACALPLICTTNSGGADLVCDGVEGFVLPIRDVEQLKDKILLLYQNQALAREMGRAARLRVQHGWSWDDYGSRITGTYGRLLSVKGLGSAVGGLI